MISIQVFQVPNSIAYTRDWQTFSVMGLKIKSLGFVGHIVSFSTTQFCCCSWKAASHGRFINEWVWLYGNKTLFVKISYFDLAADHWLKIRKKDSLTVATEKGNIKTHTTSFKNNPLRK